MPEVPSRLVPVKYHAVATVSVQDPRSTTACAQVAFKELTAAIAPVHLENLGLMSRLPTTLLTDDQNAQPWVCAIGHVESASVGSVLPAAHAST